MPISFPTKGQMLLFVREHISPELNTRMHMLTLLAVAIITACAAIYLYANNNLIHHLKKEIDNLKEALASKNKEQVDLIPPKKLDESPIKPDLTAQIINTDTSQTLENKNAGSQTIVSTDISGSKKRFYGGQLFIRTLTGKMITIESEHSEKLSSIKQKIALKENISPDQFFLMFAGRKLLDDDKMVCDYQLEKESTLHFMLKLRGD